MIRGNRQGGNRLMLLLFLALMVMLFSQILFTDRIIRAPDILNEFYWGVVGQHGKSLWSMLSINLSSADWNPYINSGHTNNGGMVSMQFQYLYRLIFGLVPPPASVAWFMVLHLFIGGVGLYYYCRLVDCSRTAALLGAIVFALCTENMSLINAGHVMKIATIAHAPWVFYFLEKGFRSGRWFHYLTAGMVLAFQFFNTHWQIAFYTCLAVGLYVVIRLLAGILSGDPASKNGRMLVMSIGMTLFFLAASAISLAPLSSWSKDTNRGVQSGANQGKGGLDREEAMMWSMPPEEMASFVIPGLLGLSRQEGGDLPKPGQTYYWGRMVFTQTASYFGLLPWLLLPLPLLFRSDRIVNTALVAVFGGVLFSMGKYTPFYQFLYDVMPGIDRFRVPKMMLFITSMGLGVLAATGLDLLRDEKIRKTKQFRQWLFFVMLLPVLLLFIFGLERYFGEWIREQIMWLLSRPTRYESGVSLVVQRWINIEYETAVAMLLASVYALLILAAARARYMGGLLAFLLIVVLVGDLWRVNRSFLVLTNPPSRSAESIPPALAWIKEQIKPENGVPPYRVLTLGDIDPMLYASAKVPVFFTANAVQKRRWQEYLDNFSLQSTMPDMMNVRWLVYDEGQYEKEKAYFGERYRPVFSSGGQIVLENPNLLPKAWIVGKVQLQTDPSARQRLIASPAFNPREVALVEAAPPKWFTGGEGGVSVKGYGAERIDLSATVKGAALLVLGEKYQSGWHVDVDGVEKEIVPVNSLLRGVYLEPGSHSVVFRFDPLPFKIGKWITLSAFALYGLMLVGLLMQIGRPRFSRKFSRA